MLLRQRPPVNPAATLSPWSAFPSYILTLSLIRKCTHNIPFFSLPNFSILNPTHILQDIACPEAVKIDDLDSAAVTKNYEAAKSAFASAELGSKAQAEAQIDIEVGRAMGAALGLSLA